MFTPRSSRLNAGIAQLVEQRIRNAKVAGSTPVSGTKQQNLKNIKPTSQV
jgi:hypothetical protein